MQAAFERQKKEINQIREEVSTLGLNILLRAQTIYYTLKNQLITFEQFINQTD